MSKKRCIPITLPYYDSLGRKIQLWMFKGSFVGSVLDQGRLSIVPGSSISNSLNPTETGVMLARRLSGISLRVWDLAYFEKINRIIVWPHMIAAGIDDLNIADEIKKMDEGFSKETRKHHKSDDLGAAVREGRGEIVKMKDSGVPWDHYEEVGQTQQYVINRNIQHTKKLLGRSNLTQDERKQLTDFLSKCSKHLDMTCGYRPKDTEATRGKMSPHMAKFYGENPQAAQKKAMQESLQFNRLTKSYNATNPNHPVPAKGATGGSIGGVGHECGIIEGLFDSLENLEEPVHYFFMPGRKEKAPFSDQVLKTLIHELAVGIFVHDSVPFFSLHFNRDSNLYPIIHPVYQNTLVGRAISLLDYHMKGFLHGVFYDESFIDEWHKKKDGDSRLLLSKCHDLRGYVRQHLPQVRSVSGAPDGYVFALGVEDAVTVSDKAYSYMARLLPEEEFVVQERFDALISAIQEKDEKAFAERFSPEMLSARDGKGATVVHYAASIEGGVSFLKRLAECKADFSVVDYFGNTPLHYAAKEGMLEQCSFLLPTDGILLAA